MAAETEKSEQPQTNGLENGLDEDERSKMRPADIDADVKEMERRKRVEMIMSSKLFREELERIIELQMKDGNGPAGLLQQISDMMGIQSGKLHTAHMFRGPNCVTPINDIRGVESMGYEKGEKNLRCKLASVFRLMDLYGWSQGINNQVTARLNQDEEHFLVNPHGMLFNEITASSLVKVDMQGNIVEPGTTNFTVNTQGFLLHSAIHASRPDVNCVIHIKTPSVLAVSSLKCGLLPICQEALVIGEVSQHPFVSGIFEPEEREKIIRNLGPHNKVLLLHNHGAVCCGATIEEAFYNVYNTVLACETQMKLMPIGVENLLLVNDETRKQVYDAAHRPPEASDKKKFRVGEMEFEALIRMLDNAGFRTGYIYRHPLVKGELPKPKNDVEVPPAVSSLGYLIEQEELYKQGNWKKYIDGRNRLDRTKWLNSPNVYQKVEILETGTSDPKKITKWVDQNSEEWVAESSPTHSSTPVKIDSALQFVPKGTNPKEFKKLQQQIKENRRADKITSGPQSHILEGVSWEDAKKLQDANITQTGDQVILVGAASKGIIQRNYQHNALVYKTPYAKNPFDSMSDKEIEDYKQLVERKQRGDTDYEESQSESEAISSSRQDGLRHFKSPLLSPQSATSETEEESRDEPRVLRIETKTAPRPIQAEVVLSDAESDTTDARVERSHSARYPKAEKPESVTLMNSFRKSWSLKREKDKSKDVETLYESRNLCSSFILKEYERDRMDPLQCCVARVKQLTHKPVIVDVDTKTLRPLLKSVSDPCNLSSPNDEDTTETDNRQMGVSKDPNTFLSCGNIASRSELQQRLKVRKRLLHSAKMKFLGYHKTGSEEETGVKTPTSPMCALISEIRETISEIMSPERSVTADDSEDYFSSMRWIERPKFVSRSTESDLKESKERLDGFKSKMSLSKSFNSLNSTETFSDFRSDFQVLKLDLENSERSDTSNCNCAIHGGSIRDVMTSEQNEMETKSEEEPHENVVTEVVKYVNASDEEGTYTITDDSLLQTYSFTESTETEWYYNKTIMKLENSQTMLEIKDTDNKEENLAAVKYIDTGIDTDFTSEKENESKNEDPPTEQQKETAEHLETTEDLDGDGDAPVCESSGLNKSSETDSSLLKSSSGRTSNDVDTSFAFKTETENSERTPEKSKEEKKKFLEEMLLKAKEPIEEESSDSGEANPNEVPEVPKEPTSAAKLSDIPESPEFTNIDTEDAPVTSSSKDTSPGMADDTGRPTEDEPKQPEIDLEKVKENLKPEGKKKKKKSSTKITVKKELKEKNSREPVVSEIRLTIKNSSSACQSEKYEVKIQDVTNTSEELSRSLSSTGETADCYESFEIVEKSCECDAQQSLEELQGEVTTTIEKLQTIEGYFEDEIQRQAVVNSEKGRNGGEECTIEYNYSELEEVLNESHKNSELFETSDVGTLENKQSTEFFVSTMLGDICGEIEVCHDPEGRCQEYENGVPDFELSPVPMEKDMEDLAMSSAFVAAILSEAVLEEGVGMASGDGETKGGEVVEVVCKIESLSDGPVVGCGDEAEVEEVVSGILERLESEKLGEGGASELKETLAENQDCQSPNIDVLSVEVTDNCCEKMLSDITLENQYCQPQITKPMDLEEPENSFQESLREDSRQDFVEQVAAFAEVENSELQIASEDEALLQVQTSISEPLVVELVNTLLNKIEENREEFPEESSGNELPTMDNDELKETPQKVTMDNEALEELPTVESETPKELFVAEMETLQKPTTELLPVVEIEAPELLSTVEEESTKQLPTVETEASLQISTAETETPLQISAIEEKATELLPTVETDTIKQLCTVEQEVTDVLPTVEPETPLQISTIEEKATELLPTVETDTTEQLHTLEACTVEQEATDVLPAVETEASLEIPTVETETPLQIPAVEEKASELLPTVETEASIQTPTVETETSLQISTIEDKATELLPTVETETTERLHTLNTEASFQICTVEQEASDLLPTVETETSLQISTIEDKATELLPTVETETTERLHTLNTEASFQLCTVEQEASDLLPTVETETPLHISTVEDKATELLSTVDTESTKRLSTVETEAPKKEFNLTELTRLFCPPTLKAITYEPQGPDAVEDILNSLLDSVMERNKRNAASVNDVINFIVTNEESPTKSEMGKIIANSTFSDIIDTIEGEWCGDLENEERMKEEENRKQKKGDSMFKVTIATASKKEIFINYSHDCSSTFNTSSDFCQLEELCNSYIKTDDVNEDFENLSSDNPDFFSVNSSGKNSLNSSFCSVDGHPPGGEQFCCVGCADDLKSPRALAIIQEVDEGDSSASSEVAATSDLR